MPQYILFFHGRSDPSPQLSPEQIQQIMQKYGRWADSLRKQGKLVGGEKLRDDDGRLVRMQNGKVVVDGPFAETKETIGGYFTVNAANYDEAVEMAKDCPVLVGGGSVQVREIEPT